MKKIDKFLCVNLKTGVQVIGFYRTVFYGVLAVVIFELFVERPKELCGRAKNANRQGSTFSNQHCDLLTTLFIASFIYATIYFILHFILLIGIYKRNHKLLLPAVITQGIEFYVLVPVHLLIVCVLITQGLIIFTILNIFLFCTDYYTLSAFYSLYEKFKIENKTRVESITLKSFNNDNREIILAA